MKRFWEKVNKTKGCWNWTGSKIPRGYGNFLFNGKHQLVHRVSWQLHFGEIPEGLFVCHKCDNRVCVNPSHLWLGTNKDNMEDMVKKGRQNKCRGSEHGMAKINEAIVIKIRSTPRSWGYIKRLSEKFGINRHLVGLILARKYWTHI